MGKTTFVERFEKTTKFYDFTYHLHKATFKGLSQFYQDYSEIEKRYADGLMKLTQEVWSQIPDLKKQNNTLLNTVKQIFNCLQTGSQLHYNYAERLTEVSSYYQSEYILSKRLKEKQMKIIRDKNKDEYEEIKDKQKRRDVLNNKEKSICKMLYENLDLLTEHENERVHKIREQTVIYFSLYRKICQKDLEKISQHKEKLVRQQFQVQNRNIQQIADMIRAQHNEYGGEQIARKSYDLAQTMIFKRQSLKNSLAMKERLSKVEGYKTQLKRIVAKYDEHPNQLYQMVEGEINYGVFDRELFDTEQRRKYGREINSTTLRIIFYEMFEAYQRSKGIDSDNLMTLQLMKAALRIQPEKSNFKASKITQFWQNLNDKKPQYRWHVKFLQILAEISSQENKTFQKLQQHVKDKEKQKNYSVSEPELNFLINSVGIDILLESLVVIRDDQPLLMSDYVDNMLVIAKFGEEFFKIERKVTVLLLLRKIQRMMVSARKRFLQPIEQLTREDYFTHEEKLQEKPDEKKQLIITTWVKLLINSLTDSLLAFYKLDIPLINFIKILISMEQLNIVSHQMRFSAQDHLYFSIKCAGYNYLKEIQQSKRLLDESVFGGSERLKCIVEAIQELDYAGISQSIFEDTSEEMATLLGVGQQKIKVKLLEEFTFPILDITDANLKMIAEQEGIDRQGYALRLGIILAKLDIENPHVVSEYNNFFDVLQKYLSATEEDYNDMLQHSRKTQLWIMEENAQATPNCIDFCSLLYKPFEFLLISLKKLQESKQTEYTKKYSEFIKLRLNSTLKQQIIKYVNFLYESLTTYVSNEPELVLKPKRLEKLMVVNLDQEDKEKYNFKETTRRLFNLLFLKEQLEEMICQFIDKDIYKELNFSIFNIDELQKIASKHPQSKDILLNIKVIVEAVLSNQDKIIRKVASINVFYFMRKIFNNLYWQEEKNAIQQFFSNANIHKFSEETFVKYKGQIEGWITLISKNIPDDFIDKYYEQFLKSFFIATRFQILNSNKFKIPLSQPELVKYLDNDAAFIANVMKQKFIHDELVIEHFQKPFDQGLEDIKSQTLWLISQFEEASLKDDKEKCKYVLVILNLRVKDEKAIQFIKKYKSIAIK